MWRSTCGCFGPRGLDNIPLHPACSPQNAESASKTCYLYAMRRLAVSCSIWFLCLVLGALAMFLLPNPSTAQTSVTPVPDTRGLKDFATIGQLAVQVQDSTGQPFFEGAAVKLFTTDIARTLSTTSDQGGHAIFNRI